LLIFKNVKLIKKYRFKKQYICTSFTEFTNVTDVLKSGGVNPMRVRGLGPEAAEHTAQLQAQQEL
jgi:hypothetical protein